MEWFTSVFGATLGAGLGVGVFIASVYTIHVIYKAILVALNEGALALRRWAHREEIIVEEWYEYDRRGETRYYYPKPERVRLAKHGKAGERVMRKAA